MIFTTKYKRQIEKQLQQSNLNYTIFRASVFMDVRFPLIGSPLSLEEVEKSTLKHNFWFSKAFYRIVKNSMNRGIALIPGSGKARHAFVSEEDVVHIVVNSVGHSQANRQIFELGGLQAVSWNEVVKLHNKLLGRKVRAFRAPSFIFKLGFYALKPFSRPAANLMGMNFIAASFDSNFDAAKLAPFIDRPLTTVEEFLQKRIKPANHP